MIKLGKWSKINLEANREIARIRSEKHIHSCEIKLDERCWGNTENHPCHKHKRNWYKSAPYLLSDYSQWVIGCPYCHDIIEKDPELTQKVFKRLRPKTLSELNIKSKTKEYMKNKTKLPKATAQKNKKADWMREHKCINCKKTLTGLLCTCGKLSVK